MASYADLVALAKAEYPTVTNNDAVYKYLGDLGFSGNIQDRFFDFLVDQGFSGSVNDMLAEWTGESGGDEFFANVVALLHFEGEDTSTTFTDQTGKTWTPSGNAQIDTAEFKFGTSSGLFDGSGDNITTAALADFGLGTDDFTIECFIKTNLLGTSKYFFSKDTSNNFLWALKTSGNIISVAGTGFTALNSTATITTGQWYHIAIVRNGTDMHLFVDGNLEDTASSITFNGGVSSAMAFGGTISGVTGTSNWWNGWVDDARITKGVARYTANFTPPSMQFPDS